MFCAEGMDHTQPDWFRLVSLFSPVLSPCSPFSLSFSLSVSLSLSLSRARAPAAGYCTFHADAV
jgi:hypothetical protein